MNVGSRVRENIRQLRQSSGLSLDELGRRSGLTGTYIGRLERGDHRNTNPTIGTIEKIANAFGVTVSDLVTGKGQKGFQNETPESQNETLFDAPPEGNHE